MNTSLKKYSRVLKQEGTSRQERYMPDLHETDALLDNRKLQDMILYMQQYSKNLLFVNTDDDSINHKESWEYFFLNDPVLLIASIGSLNTQKIKEEYDNLNDIFKKYSGIGNFAELTKYVLVRFIAINSWYTSSSKTSLLYQDLHLYIGSYLQKEVENVKEMMLYCFDHLGDDTNVDKKNDINNNNEKIRLDIQNMDSIWKLDQKEKLSLREKLFAGANENEKLINASVILNKIFKIIFYTTETIVEKSWKYFDQTIHHDQNHDPHVALIITFIELFKYQQKELNKIPQRLLNFYYREVLKIKEKVPEPDQTYVVFELAKGFNTSIVKKGIKLTAGKDKLNNELVYATDKDIVINQAKVTTLRTAYIDRNTSGEIINYYTDIITDIPGHVNNIQLNETNIPKMFGEQNKRSVTKIGFAIASSQFYLAKGERNVIITLNSVGDIEPAEVINNNKGLNDFDAGIIQLILTGEKGWINSDDADSGITINSFKKIGNAVIELNFSIAIAQEQAIVAFVSKLHAGNFNTNFPVLKCVLKFPDDIEVKNNKEEQIRQLNIIQKLQIKTANISVQVGNKDNILSFDGVKDLLLENDESILDNKRPFYPFTPVPRVSSSFYIGCNDLFYKKIQTLSINIEWLLPDNFSKYYQRYNSPYDSNKFRATLSFLEKNRWKKYSEISLIDTNANNSTFKVFKMNMDKVMGDATIGDEDIPSYDNVKQNGTIKLKLGYPDFGHSIYPQLITSTVMDKSKGNVDYYKLLKKRLHDDIFTIELPPDIDSRNGPLKVIYDILSNFKDDGYAKNMLVTALGDIISRNNDVFMVTKKTDQSADIFNEIQDEKGSEVIVHDQNFIERVLRIFRKLNVVGEDVHNDKEKQGVENVLENLEVDIYEVADFILPSKEEMYRLIITEVNKSINQTVANAVVIILEARAETKNVDTNRVAKILNDEFDKARKVINDMIAKRIAASLSVNQIPPPPYSPLINAISLNYSSSKQMSRNDGDKVFHLTFSGSVAETNIWQDNNTQSFALEDAFVKSDYIFPQPITSIVHGKSTPMQGMLFIGVANLLPNQNLSLLFQLAEGTKNNDQLPPPLMWCYIRHNEWVPLKKDDLISDGTNDLQTTGIIEFSIPADADNVNTFFNTKNQYWLCAAVAANADYFPLLTDVKAQAVKVTFVNHLQNQQHMLLPLEAERIKKVIDDLPEIKKITQPVPSFNGKVGEKVNDYFIRVSERLRHKDRAINNWDYENLVLQVFPGIFKVKCLNNYYNGHFAVGHVTVVPIADLRNKNYAGNNLLVPKTNFIELKKIENFLCARSSPFVKIHAINPKLEHVLIKCKVKFYSGVDKGFYIKKLNDELIEFLTPWSTDAEKISFSAKIFASSIINFIDKRDYVDFVMDMVMLQYTEDETGKKTFVFNAQKLASLVATEITTDHSILVSAPQHQIQLTE